MIDDAAAGTAPPKPRQRRREQRPGEIIAAGFAEFAANGFEGTRLEDVAARAGVVKGTIYRYFDSKEALFEAVVRSRLTSNLDAIGMAISSYPGSATALLEHMIGQLYELVLKSEAHVLMRILIAEGPRFPGITEFYHREVISKGTALIGAVIRLGVERGEFRDGPLARLPMVLFAPGLMAAIWQLTFARHQPIDLDAFKAAHVDLVLNGLKLNESA